MNDSPFLIWSSASVCHVGKVRKVNEDACLNMPELGLWAVADGMGGHEAGDLASDAVVQHLGALARADDLTQLIQQIQSRLAAANQHVYQESQRRGRLIGSTVAVLAAYGQTAACLWAGDSRVYRHRGGLLKCLTHDHSVVEEQVAQGLATRESAQKNYPTNAITRAVGPRDELDLDVEFTQIQHGDTFVVCTDGLYRDLSDDELADILSRGAMMEGEARRADAETLAQALISAALARGGRDNISVVVVKFVNPF